MVKTAAIPNNGVMSGPIFLCPFLSVAVRNCPGEAFLWPRIFCFSHSAHGDMITVHAETLPTSTLCFKALRSITAPVPVSTTLRLHPTDCRQETAAQSAGSIVLQCSVICDHLWSYVGLPGWVDPTDNNRIGFAALSCSGLRGSKVCTHLWSAVRPVMRADPTVYNRIEESTEVPATHCDAQASYCW